MRNVSFIESWFNEVSRISLTGYLDALMLESISALSSLNIHCEDSEYSMSIESGRILFIETIRYLACDISVKRPWIVRIRLKKVLSLSGLQDELDVLRSNIISMAPSQSRSHGICVMEFLRIIETMEINQ